MNEGDPCTSHENGRCLKVDDCEAYGDIAAATKASNVIAPEQMNKLREHYCGFIPGDGSEKMKLLYCCPSAATKDEPSSNATIFKGRSHVDEEFDYDYDDVDDSGCKTKDGKTGSCVEDEQCASASRIIYNDIQDQFHIVRQNRCGEQNSQKVCCANEEILKGNQCFNDRMEIGECDHYSECNEFVKLGQKHRFAKTKFSKEEKLFWNRSKCQPKGAAAKRLKKKVSNI